MITAFNQSALGAPVLGRAYPASPPALITRRILVPVARRTIFVPKDKLIRVPVARRTILVPKDKRSITVK